MSASPDVFPMTGAAEVVDAATTVDVVDPIGTVEFAYGVVKANKFDQYRCSVESRGSIDERKKKCSIWSSYGVDSEVSVDTLDLPDRVEVPCD